jgi:hypothetical protein
MVENKYGENDYDTGDYVKCGKEYSGRRTLQNTCTGWMPGRSIQVTEYGVKFIYHERGLGDRTGSGDAG